MSLSAWYPESIGIAEGLRQRQLAGAAQLRFSHRGLPKHFDALILAGV